MPTERARGDTSPVTPLRIAICGSGNRSRSVWQRHVRELDGFELVGVQDTHAESLEKSIEAGTISRDQMFLDIEQMLTAARPDAVIVCPVHAAHAAATEAAIAHGAHALVEKPFVTRTEDAIRIADLADEAGLHVGVVQNWRTKSVGQALKRAIDDDMIGRVSHIFFRYLRDRELPHLPEYLFDEPDPMLFALTVHHVDLLRWVLGDEIAVVEGRAFHPPWSRYRHPSVMQLWLETEGGIAISYSGTISSRNGHYFGWEHFIVEGELGSIFNESDFSDPPLLLSRRDDKSPVDLTAGVTERAGEEQYALGDRTLLLNFAAAIRGAEPLISSARENIGTVAAIDATRLALHEGRSVRVREVIEAAGGA
jgi:predicted dehydrogenase